MAATVILYFCVLIFFPEQPCNTFVVMKKAIKMLFQLCFCKDLEQSGCRFEGANPESK